MSIPYNHDNCLLCTKKVSYLKNSHFQRKESERNVIKLIAYSITSGCSSCLLSCLFNKIYNPYAVAKTKTAPTRYMAKKPLADIIIPQIKAPEAIPKSENIKKVDIACPLRSVVVL